jgi:tRNA nucleotidyltransferase (CCA-adding enzyme)
MKNIYLPEDLRKLFNVIGMNTPGSAYLVGGAVRDSLFGMQPEDYDIEVYGVDKDVLFSVLNSYYPPVKMVGATFGIFMVKTEAGRVVEVALPRRENKSGVGHKEFEILTDPNMTTAEASYRRDFTINAMLYDPYTQRLIDHYGGENDLKNGLLDPVSEKFKEDPLRVLRAMQFISRFNLDPSEALLQASRELFGEYETLSKERVWAEWNKWATRGKDLGAGLQFLFDSGWIHHYPELRALKNVPQDPEYHPEGDVLEHTKRALNVASGNPPEIIFATLLHDTGKALTTVMTDGKIRSPGHEKASAVAAYKFLERIGAPKHLISYVLPLVQEHMFLYSAKTLEDITDRAIRRLSIRLKPTTIEWLSVLVYVDKASTGSVRTAQKYHHFLMDRAKDLDVVEDQPKPLLRGKHLLDRGIPESKRLGDILREAFELQLDGQITTVEEAVEWLEENYHDEFNR